MDTQKYLEKVLNAQKLEDDSKELKDLQKHREDVEKILRDGFPESSPVIRYGGSKAKNTLIRELYDLDIVCYFLHDDTAAGSTLEEIYNNVRSVLQKQYFVEPKTSAVRLKDANSKIDFHIDVVPGRYVDDSKTDCFIYQNGTEKNRLKTNIETHIAFIRDSGVVPAIKLSKLWKVRRGLRLKQFVFELLVIKLLENKKDDGLEKQLKHVWTAISEAEDPILVEDPANPTGNDLSEAIKSVWPELSARSRDTLDLLARSGWEAIFGEVEDEADDKSRASGLISAAAAIAKPNRQWSPGI
jgi:tRNA nucleotidyltransferase (CCA-adding enzyme)